MGVFQRLGDILSANVNDLVDKFENPQKMLQQAVREMETEIADATRIAAKALATEKLLARSVGEKEGELGAWQERAVRAVAAGDDALARKALSRKQQCETMLEAEWTDLVGAENAGQALRRQLEDMKSRYDDARNKLSVLVVRQQAREARTGCCGAALDARALNTRAFDRFERMKDKVERAEAEAEAMLELLRTEKVMPAPSEPTLEDLAVEEELAALKASLRK